MELFTNLLTRKSFVKALIKPMFYKNTVGKTDLRSEELKLQSQYIYLF